MQKEKKNGVHLITPLEYCRWGHRPLRYFKCPALNWPHPLLGSWCTGTLHRCD